jgi:hypothetical protein
MNNKITVKNQESKEGSNSFAEFTFGDKSSYCQKNFIGVESDCFERPSDVKMD